jgi:integrase/recombinase XerD
VQINQARADFLKGYFSTHQRRNKTKSSYSSDIAQFQEFVGQNQEILRLKGIHIENWAAHLEEKGYSPASIRRKIGVLKVFFSYWVRNGELPESPFWRVKISYGRIEQLPRTLTEAEMRKLLNEAQNKYEINKNKGAEAVLCSNSATKTYLSLRNLALVELLFATGMRVGEVSSIDLKDFLVNDALFKITGKGGRERLSFIVDKVTLQIQRKHLKARMKIETSNSALFLNSAGKRLSTQGIAKILAQLCQSGGIKRHITPHMLRHTVATLLLRNGVDIRIVQEFLGHSSIATTQRYVHIVKDHMIRELRNRHPSLNIHTKINSLKL